jgi:GMP synthase (glutamine-hydrolysing)
VIDMLIPAADIGGQYNHMITRCLKELGVESGLVPLSITVEELTDMGTDGFVMGGGPQRAGSEVDKLGNLPNLIKNLKIPMLGMCVSHQLMAIVFGGKAGPAELPEYGPIKIFIDDADEILKNIDKTFVTWEAHNDEVIVLPKDFKILAHSEKCKIEAMRHVKLSVFGLQFHPEVDDTKNGRMIFKNFIEICKNE